jgi:predicted nucleotidyltransferase
MGMEEIIDDKREAILTLAAQDGASNARVLGSGARDEANADADFLVELEEGRDLFDLGGLLMSLRDRLPRNVGIITEGAIDSHRSESSMESPPDVPSPK